MREQLKEGDEFIRISKYGRVFGVVKSVFSVLICGDECNYYEFKIESTNGIIYEMSECYKVERKLYPEEIIRRKTYAEKIKALKSRKPC